MGKSQGQPAYRYFITTGIPYEESNSLNMNAQLSSGARGMNLHLCPYLVCASSAGTDATTQKLRLV